VRWRSVIHALSTELFGTSMAIPDFPNRPDLVGVGLSDWNGYAVRLGEKLSYTNTYYHREPLLDISSVDSSKSGQYDFIIASDVFEHIAPPVSKAFDNARRLLKPGGVMIFTVPYIDGETVEHFPELHQYSIQKRQDQWVLLNKTCDGREQEFTEITFHGGPGTIIEMRRFGKDGLLRNIHDAGFGDIKLYDEEYLSAGIRWMPYVAEEAPYRPLIYGLDTPPWALRNRSSSTK
jgi:SAM-dependent methyltransferase